LDSNNKCLLQDCTKITYCMECSNQTECDTCLPGTFADSAGTCYTLI